MDHSSKIAKPRSSYYQFDSNLKHFPKFTIITTFIKYYLLLYLDFKQLNRSLIVTNNLKITFTPREKFTSFRTQLEPNIEIALNFDNVNLYDRRSTPTLDQRRLTTPPPILVLVLISTTFFNNYKNESETNFGQQ